MALLNKDRPTPDRPWGLILAIGVIIAGLAIGGLLYIASVDNRARIAALEVESAQEQGQAAVALADAGQGLAQELTEACRAERVDPDLTALCAAAMSLAAAQPASVSPAATPAGQTSTIAVTGPSGPSGAPGADGRDGRSGAAGSGAVGAQGPVGSGVAGADGANGAAGADGADGANGTIVILGENGAPGADSTVAGPAGPPGADSTIPGPVGAAGAAGADSTIPGPVGAAGPDGRGLSVVECLTDGTWRITFTDGSTALVAGPCRAVIVETTVTTTETTTAQTTGAETGLSDG